MRQSSEFCRHNTLCCFSASVYFCKRIFRYLLSPETFGYIVVRLCVCVCVCVCVEGHAKIWAHGMSGTDSKLAHSFVTYLSIG
jgi:hypothetical protein